MRVLPLLLLAACTTPSANSEDTEDTERADTDPADTDPADDTDEPPEGDGSFFDRTRIGSIDLLLTDAASQELGTSEPSTDTYVETGVRIGTSGDPITLDRVGVQVKGTTTWVQWPGKSSLKLKLDAFVAGQDVDGFERVALHNLIADRTFLRESLAWWAFRELGVPAARASHVSLQVNGAPHGEPNELYVMVEAMNGDFLEQWFADASGPVWEGPGDFGRPEALECDRGDCTDTTKLLALADAVENASDEEFMAATGAYLDWDAFFRFWAVEAMVQQSDGYTGLMNNFRIYWEPTKERFYLIPWSLDLTLREPGALSLPDRHPLVNRCLSIDACRSGFEDALLAAADDWEDADAVGELDRMKALLVTEGYWTTDSESELARVREVVADRPATARAWVEAN